MDLESSSGPLRDRIDAAAVSMRSAPRAAEAFASFHVDDAGMAWPASVGAVVQSFVDQTRRVVDDVEVALALPAGICPELLAAAPDLATCVVDPGDPPSVYVFAHRYFILAAVTDREEYVCPYDSNPWSPELRAVYACGRAVHARRAGWEFDRTVWLWRTNEA